MHSSSLSGLRGVIDADPNFSIRRAACHASCRRRTRGHHPARNVISALTRTARSHPDRLQRELGMKRLLMQIEHEIRRIGEVSHVEMKFRNWGRVGLQWVPRSGAVESVNW